MNQQNFFLLDSESQCVTESIWKLVDAQNRLESSWSAGSLACSDIALTRPFTQDHVHINGIFNFIGSAEMCHLSKGVMFLIPVEAFPVVRIENFVIFGHSPFLKKSECL